MAKSPASAATKSGPSDLAVGMALGLLGVVIFSGTLPATRIAISTFDPAFLTFARAGLATVAAIACLKWMGRSLLDGPLALMVGIGLLLVFGFPGFVAIAMQTVPSAHGGIVLGILPLATAIFAVAIAGEKVSPLFWFCGVLGALIVIAFALRGGTRAPAIGDLWLLMAGLSAALGYVLSGKLGRQMPGWEIICRALILVAPLTLIGMVLTFETAYLTPPLGDAIAFVYLGLGSMFLGFFAWNAGLTRGGIARVGQLQLFQTFFTIAIAALLIGEEVTWDMLGYAIAVFVTVAIGQRARTAKASPRP
ncbi:MAG: DMT family transporter [Pseudomonadota bacterium]